MQQFRRKLANLLILAILTCLTQGLNPAAASTPEERIDGSIKILRRMAEQQDTASMASFIKRGKGLVIFPKVVKTGFAIGGKTGKGLILQRDASTGKWFGPSFVDVLGASFGLQFGVQVISLVLVINNEQGLEPFTKGDNVTIGADFGIAAGPVGRRTEAATDIQAKASIYSYSMSKGLFAGVSLEGATIRVDQNANTAYWEKQIWPTESLKIPATDKRILPLIEEIEKLLKTAE